MHEDNIERLWRKVMYTSADNCPMEFAKALAERAALAERERWETAARLVIESTPEQLPMALDALADVLWCNAADVPPQVGHERPVLPNETNLEKST